MKKHIRLFGAALATALLYQAWSITPSNAGPFGEWGRHKYPDRLWQIAPIDRLMAGGYDGTTTVAEVQRNADFGIGTFNGLDGEMIMLDGVVYQAPSSGVLRAAKPSDLIPFATLTRFHAERVFTRRSPLTDYAALQTFLNESMPDQSQILAIKVHGICKTLKLRAPQKQVQPYPSLADALKAQVVFDLTNVSGTFVGYRFPAYIGTVNSAGYHFHFVTDDRSTGGHVLEVSTSSVVAAVETVEQYDITLAPAD